MPPHAPVRQICVLIRAVIPGLPYPGDLVPHRRATSEQFDCLTCSAAGFFQDRSKTRDAGLTVETARF
jgi:hypothetical protein